MDKSIKEIFPKEYFKKGNEGFEVYSEIWNILKKYEHFAGTDKEWGDLIDDIDKTYKKFDNCEMVRSLCCGVVSFFENTWKKKNIKSA